MTANGKQGGADGHSPDGTNGVPGGGSPGEGGAGEAQPPRIPPPRSAADDSAAPPTAPRSGAHNPGVVPLQREPGSGPGTGEPVQDAPQPDGRTPGDMTSDSTVPDSAASDSAASDSAASAGAAPDSAIERQGPAEPAATSPWDSAQPSAQQQAYEHRVLKSLLGAWALAACSSDEATAVEDHLTDCATCAEEALRLRDAVGLLHPEDSLDLDPALRSHVLEGCLGRRQARIPVPAWAAPYESETARLDALLRDMAEDEWSAPVRLRWFDGTAPAARDTTVAGVIAHLLAVDGLVAGSLGLSDPLLSAGMAALPSQSGRGGPSGPTARTEVLWEGAGSLLQPLRARNPWREQSRTMVRTASFRAADAGEETDIAEKNVSYGSFALPLRDAFLERAFGCWVHAGDIAEAIDYPYGPPDGEHLHHMVDLAARLLPDAIAKRRRAGLAASEHRLTAAGAPSRTLHLEIEGAGGGDWYIALDSPGATPSRKEEVAHVALDGLEFCQLAAGHIPPQEAAAGQDGDRDAIRDVLYAAASLSRM